ncbi:MAG TPA: HD domain-containing protein, partial [bacterium]|nr:HD domain-containing protein [bacterium]
PLVAETARILLLLGEFVRVEALANTMFSAARKTDHPTAMIRSQIFLGYIYFNLFEFENSRQAYLNGMAMLGDAPEDIVRRVVFLSNLSIAAVETEDLDQAVTYGRRALRLLNTIKPAVFNRAAATAGTPPYAVQRSTVMSNLGYLYQEKGVRAQAPKDRERLLVRAARYNIRSLHGPIPMTERIRSEANLGSTMMHRGRVVEAYTLFKRLIRRCGSDPALDRLKGWIYGFMSECAMRLNAPDIAIRHCHTSLRTAIRSADPFSESEILRMALEPLKTIYSDLFRGEHSGRIFMEQGMPVIRELLDFLEDKDWYTARDHSRGVARIALALHDVLADTLPGHSTDHDRNTLEIASLMHDIGKLWIPWSILNRLTPLWPRDFDVIKRHPGRGRRFMEELGFHD